MLHKGLISSTKTIGRNNLGFADYCEEKRLHPTMLEQFRKCLGDPNDTPFKADVIGTLIRKPVWMHNSSDNESLASNKMQGNYNIHRVFLCGIDQEIKGLQDLASHISFINLDTKDIPPAEITLAQQYKAYSIKLFKHIKESLQKEITGRFFYSSACFNGWSSKGPCRPVLTFENSEFRESQFFYSINWR